LLLIWLLASVSLEIFNREGDRLSDSHGRAFLVPSSDSAAGLPLEPQQPPPGRCCLSHAGVNFDRLTQGNQM